MSLQPCCFKLYIIPKILNSFIEKKAPSSYGVTELRSVQVFIKEPRLLCCLLPLAMKKRVMASPQRYKKGAWPFRKLAYCIEF